MDYYYYYYIKLFIKCVYVFYCSPLNESIAKQIAIFFYRINKSIFEIFKKVNKFFLILFFQ